MKNINTFFKEIFDIKEISDSGLLHFTMDHIKNLQKHNADEKYNHYIRTTSFLFQRFLDAYCQKQNICSVKIDRTKEVGVLLEKTKEQIRNLEAYIRAFNNKESEIYNGFFPNGLSEYSRITKSNITSLMSRIHFAAEKYQDNIDSHIIANLFETEEQYYACRKEQVKRKNAFKATLDSKKELRKELAIQLQFNLFDLAKEHIGQPHKESSFFNTNLLQEKTFDTEKNSSLKTAREMVT